MLAIVGWMLGWTGQTGWAVGTIEFFSSFKGYESPPRGGWGLAALQNRLFPAGCAARRPATGGTILGRLRSPTPAPCYNQLIGLETKDSAT